jgi:class 3 adenylate cyclase
MEKENLRDKFNIKKEDNPNRKKIVSENKKLKKDNKILKQKNKKFKKMIKNFAKNLKDYKKSDVVLKEIIKQYTPKSLWKKALEFVKNNKGIEDLNELNNLDKVSITMLFADIMNYTKFSEKYSPEEVIKQLNEIFEYSSGIVYKNNGDIDKFIGDAFLAVFPTPLDALKAAWEISNGTDNINDDYIMSERPPLFFRFGINTGEVVRGDIGGKTRRSNTIIGDAVNLTQRLESESMPGQIIISSDTYEKVKDHVNVSKEVKLDIKGRDQPVLAYYVEKIIY